MRKSYLTYLCVPPSLTQPGCLVFRAGAFEVALPIPPVIPGRYGRMSEPVAAMGLEKVFGETRLRVRSN